MRTIKFRAYDKEMMKMYVVQDLHLETGSIHTTTGERITKHDLALMQFTGLLDKNGKEIYEGDIVKTGSIHLYEVAWGEGSYEGYYGYSGIILKEAYEAGTDQQDALNWEVIGNIYEHSHLLSTKDTNEK